MKLAFTYLALVAILLVAPAGAFADTGFRCGTYIVSQGLFMEKVLEYCGEPTERMDDDTWVYNRGSEEFTVIVHFAPDNTVDRITNTE